MKEVHLMELNDMAYELNKLKKGKMAVFAIGPAGTYSNLPTYTKDLINRLVKEGRITTAQKKVGVLNGHYSVHVFQHIAIGVR